MSTKLLMIASAIVMGITGLMLMFMPTEVLRFLNQEQNGTLTLMLQLMGALYIGFAILNWTAKNVLIGGIYAKPLSLGNFINFFIGALTLIKVVMNGEATAIHSWVLTILYVVFAAAFGYVSFTGPKIKAQDGKA